MLAIDAGKIYTKYNNIYDDLRSRYDTARVTEGVIEMDFLEKLGDTITTKGKEAADKAKELAEIANLKSQISTCEEVIKKNYMEIGKIYFEQYGDIPEAPFEKQCRAINNAKRGATDLQEKIKEIKGIQYQ